MTTTISYAIPACNEYWSLKNLIESLLPELSPGDQIIIQLDEGNFTENVETLALEFMETYGRKFDNVEYPTVKVIYYPLNNDFAQFKNNLKANCDAEWIFQIDADELLADSIKSGVRDLIEANRNEKVELYHIPRVNIVEGLTLDHVKKWGWKLYSLRIPSLISSMSKDEMSSKHYDLLKWQQCITEEDEYEITFYNPLVNWPDSQARLFKNKPEIKWTHQVHEQIVGHKVHAPLPLLYEWSIIHVKDIKRQERQNEFYETI